MKNKLFTAGIIVSLILFVFCSCNLNKINIPDNATAKIVYKYDDKNINESLNEDESLIIKDIFNGKELFYDNPSCGFNANISLSFDNKTFMIACDGCSIIKYNNKYFNVSDSQIEQIHNIMQKYGAKFPCI